MASLISRHPVEKGLETVDFLDRHHEGVNMLENEVEKVFPNLYTH